MPEGHSIHRLARQFTDVFAGRRLRVSSPQGRFEAGARLLDGQVLRGARAHGKHLFLEFGGAGPTGGDAERVLRVHLGLYGAFSFGGDETFRGASSIGAPRRMGESDTYDAGPALAYAGPPDPVGQVRVRLVSEHGWADLRGPSACEVITPAEAAAVVDRLGPDPLVPGTGPGRFLQRVSGRGMALGQLLMDQAVVAGVGNIYRAESLFRQGLDPPPARPAAGARGRRGAVGGPRGVDAGRRAAGTDHHDPSRAPRRPDGGWRPGPGVAGQRLLRLPAGRPGLPGVRDRGAPGDDAGTLAVLVPGMPVVRPAA